MAKLEIANCHCEEPCSHIKFEGEVYPGLESIVDALVEERDNLLSYVDVLENEGGFPPIV
jgi:hypothetical protein